MVFRCPNLTIDAKGRLLPEIPTAVCLKAALLRIPVLEQEPRPCRAELLFANPSLHGAIRLKVRSVAAPTARRRPKEAACHDWDAGRLRSLPRRGPCLRA